MTHTHTQSIAVSQTQCLGGRTQSYIILGRPPGLASQSYIGYPLKSVAVHNLGGPCMKISCNVLIGFALCFSKLKVDWARLTPAVTSWMDTPWPRMGVRGCTSLLYNNVCCFLCLMCFKEKQNKTK